MPSQGATGLSRLLDDGRIEIDSKPSKTNISTAAAHFFLSDPKLRQLRSLAAPSHVMNGFVRRTIGNDNYHKAGLAD